MFDFSVFFNPVILAIIISFIGVVAYFVSKVQYINMSLIGLTNILKSFRKGNIVYRFKELDDMFLKSPFISNYWVEFKNTLVFNEGISLKGAAPENSSIQCTMDSSYFFNEETLINSKLNYKFISNNFNRSWTIVHIYAHCNSIF